MKTTISTIFASLFAANVAQAEATDINFQTNAPTNCSPFKVLEAGCVDGELLATFQSCRMTPVSTAYSVDKEQFTNSTTFMTEIIHSTRTPKGVENMITELERALKGPKDAFAHAMDYMIAENMLEELVKTRQDLEFQAPFCSKQKTTNSPKNIP